MNPQDNPKQAGLSWSVPQTPSPKPAEPPKDKPKEKKPATPPAVSGPTANASKVAGWIAAGIVAGVVIAWGGSTLLQRNETSSPTSTAADTLKEPGGMGTGSDQTLSIPSPQKAGRSVTVAKAVVSEPTWIVVYESRGGIPGNVLGAALFFPDRQSGSVGLLRSTTAGQIYFVTKFSDDGDHKFSLHGDAMLKENGEPVWVSFTAN